MNKIVAIVGMSGSGKSSATDHLVSLGYKRIYFGGVTYRLMEKHGVKRTTDGKAEKEFRESLRKKYGKDCYAKFLEDDIRKASVDGNVVLDGLYSWWEYKYLIDKFPNLILICIVCDKKIRYNRVSVRPTRAFKDEAIVERDLSEIENLAKGGPIAFADYYILNNGSMDSMIERLDEVIKEIGE